jgi:hypothetical protein
VAWHEYSHERGAAISDRERSDRAIARIVLHEFGAGSDDG